MSSALALAACSFDSEHALFRSDEGATPFADNSVFEMRDHAAGEGDAEQEVVELHFSRSGGGYVVVGNGHRETPIDALFVALPETPEEDYLAQLKMEPGSEVRTFLFLWRSGGVFKFILAPAAFDDFPEHAAVVQRLCISRALNGCSVASREDLIELYRDAVYPTFVAPDATFHGLGYLVPMSRKPKAQQ